MDYYDEDVIMVDYSLFELGIKWGRLGIWVGVLFEI